MVFQERLIQGILLRRYQRFLADVDIDGNPTTVHCPNSGSMMGLSTPGSPVWVSVSENSKRRFPHTLQLVEIGGGLVGINTGMPNRLVEEAIRTGVIAPLGGYGKQRREVRYGVNSRVDFLLEEVGLPSCYVEVKNVHLSRSPGRAEFPDCVTARGAKHLRELAAMARSGARAVMVFCVQRADCHSFSLASDLDPAYAKAFEEATASGVETLIYSCHITLAEISIVAPLEFSSRSGRA